MARGKDIIVSSGGSPRGVFLEGTFFGPGTILPGTHVQPRTPAGMSSGRGYWEPYAPGANGDPRLLAVVLPDFLQGRTETQAYSAGERIFIYCPYAGEELNVVLGSTSSQPEGTMLTLSSGSGKAIPAAGTEKMLPYKLLEDLSAGPAANYLAWVSCTGK